MTTAMGMPIQGVTRGREFASFQVGELRLGQQDDVRGGQQLITGGETGDVGRQQTAAAGDPLTARFEAEYDQRITNKLILQPAVEFDFAAQDVPQIGIAASADDSRNGSPRSKPTQTVVTISFV